jgi:chromosome segregation ATPase
MTDIEALRARMRELALAAKVALLPVGGTSFNEALATLAQADANFRDACTPDAFLALDAEITRLREDLDRVTRERDEAQERETCAKLEHAAAEAALAKRDEEVARLREALMPLANAMSSIRLRANDPDDALLEILVAAGDVRRAATLTKELANAE